MNDKQIQEAFIQFLAQKSGAKTQQELEKYVQSLGEDGLKQAYQEFTQTMQKQAQKAAHGVKLQYFKSLKHQCAEDEHLEYFAKGGNIGCNCVKNEKKGGKAEPKKNAIDQFKEKKCKKGCGGVKLGKKFEFGGSIEDLRKSLGLEKKNN